MRTLAIIFILLLMLSLLLNINAYPNKQQRNHLLRAQYMDYLRNSRREQLRENQLRGIMDGLSRQRKNFYGDGDGMADEFFTRHVAREKIVGLLDDPLK